MSKEIEKVSVHGGHSGQFCHHAQDSLEEVIQAYIAQGFSWVGITEHMPPVTEQMRYQDEVEAGIELKALQQSFMDYFSECRSLQKKYAGQIEIMTAFETETYPGSVAFIKKLVASVKPDYLVGSVHHVAGIGIDYSRELYQQAVAATGSLEQLYCGYFDAQYEMLVELRPAVVGHFDLIRIFDDAYFERLAVAEVWQKVERNLAFIAENDLILDFNLRGFDKSTEQYPSMPVLTKALAMGVSVVPGDDSHGLTSVGKNYSRGVSILTGLGASTEWKKPTKLVY